MHSAFAAAHDPILLTVSNAAIADLASTDPSHP
jgi:hypothetical protein